MKASPLLLLALFLVGCGSFGIQVPLLRPGEATATALAQVSPMPESTATAPAPTHLATTPPPALGLTAPLTPMQADNTQVATRAPTPSTMGLGKLAYLQDGDIWVKAVPDGDPQRLTTDGRSSQPRWSPSGGWLAFRRDVTGAGDVFQAWLVRADGSQAYALENGSPVERFAWAPAEDRLAYTAGGELRLLQAGEAEARILVSTETRMGFGPGQAGRFIWQPGGTWLTYEWREGQPGQPPRYQAVWTTSTDGHRYAPLYEGGSAEVGAAYLVEWTRDERALILQQNWFESASLLADGTPLYSLPIETGVPVLLAPSTLAYADFVAPDPSGTDRVAVVVGGGREAWTSKVLQVIQATSGISVTVSPADLAVASLSWSPDGQHLAFAAMTDRGGEVVLQGETVRQALMQRRLWIANIQGEPQPRRLTDDPAYRDERPLWSTDGLYLLFARLDDQDRASLWLMPAAEPGGEPQRVVEELSPSPGFYGYYGHIEWDLLFDWWR